MADIIIEKIYRKPVFTWGTTNLYNKSDARLAYLTALRSADKGDYSLLIDFARSWELQKLLIMLVSLLSDNVCLVNFSNFRSIQEIAPYAHHL